MPIFAESLCAWAGISLFIAGVISLFVPHHFRFGVVSMLTGDLFFALAIVFPKNITDIMRSLGFSQGVLAEKQLVGGVFLGLAVFSLLYGTRFLLKKLLRLWSVKKKDGTMEREENGTAADSSDSSPKLQPRRNLTNSAKTADPGLFSSVARKN